MIMQKNLFIKLSFLIGLALIFSLTGLRCTKGTDAEVAEASKPVTIKWWRVYDDESAVTPIIEAYRVAHPNVTIEYRKLRFEDYENELLNALAEDRGPDIISLHNTWIRQYQPKLTPLPPTITLPFSELQGSFKKEVVNTLKTNATLSAKNLKENFVDVVAKDTLITTKDSQNQPQEQIFGLPLALDTLTLFANRDLLNISGIPEVPQTWSEFQSAVKKLTRLDKDGNIIQSGAAIGSSKNIERATDILALLMMQNGAEMINSAGDVAFNKIPASLKGISVPPGEQALTFYTDFADSQKETYTWSAQQQNSFDAFVAGKTAMFFGYAYHLPLIHARAPRMNLAIAPVPQIEGNPKVTFANYWVETVTRKSANPQWAWDFIQFATSAKNISPYLERTNKPTALRALIQSQTEKEEVGIFAEQILTAQSWYRGNNSLSADFALLDAIDAVHSNMEPQDALNIAAGRVKQTMR